MLTFKEWIINTIINDPTMQGYLYKDSNNNYAVFPVDVDVSPEQFPCITYNDAGITVLSVPQGMHVGIFQMNIWSINSALETENIYERLGQLLNFQSSATATQSPTGTLWWIRENGVHDMHSPSRRIWHKVVDLKIWFDKTDNT